jgi:predicted AAA+ superfamily ATPase
MWHMQPATEEFSRAFEHFLIEELRAYLNYTERYLPLSYWRTSTGLEVDLIVGDLDLAIECKAVPAVDERHTKSLRALMKTSVYGKRLLSVLTKFRVNSLVVLLSIHGKCSARSCGPARSRSKNGLQLL